MWPLFRRKKEEIKKEIGRLKELNESNAEQLYDTLRESIESDASRVAIQLVDEILDFVHQRRDEMIELLSVGGAERQVLLQKLKPCQREAYYAYQYATARLEDQTTDVKDPTDKKIYQWLKDYGYRDYRLPEFETWTRHLRVAREVLGEQRNKSPHDRGGRSIIRPSRSKRSSSKVRLTPKERQERAVDRLRDLANELCACPPKGPKPDSLWGKAKKVLHALGISDSEIEKVVRAGPERLAKIADAFVVRMDRERRDGI